MTRHVTRIFILRPDNLGDLVLFSGCLKNIRQAYPNSRITMAVQNSLRNLFEFCPHIDRLISYEEISSFPCSWLPNLRGKYRLNWIIRKLLNKKLRTDLVLLPVRSPTNDLFGMHSIVSTISASQKIGISGDYSNQSRNEDIKADKIYTSRMEIGLEQQETHELAINTAFLNYLGIEVSPNEIMPDFWTDSKDRSWAAEYIPINRNLVSIAICPGVVSHPNKFYPGNKYAQIFMELDDIQFSVAIFGSPFEKHLCKEVSTALENCNNIKTIVDLSGQTSIRQLIEGIRRCDILVSLDTAALHIGVALRKPTVGIIGGGHYGRFYPWGNNKINRVANKYMDCYWCNWKCIYPTTKCIQDIEPGNVAEELRTAMIEAHLT